MITKQRTKNSHFGIYFLVLPLMSLMLFAFSGTKDLSPVSLAWQEKRIIPSACPVAIEKVTGINGFGNRKNPFTGKEDFHKGIDFAIAVGEEVFSTADGTVTEVSSDPAKGTYITIRHDNVYTTFYSHLKSTMVKSGEKVKLMQVIGYTGNTGSSSTGPHLHYEVMKNGEWVNPEDYMALK